MDPLPRVTPDHGETAPGVIPEGHSKGLLPALRATEHGLNGSRAAAETDAGDVGCDTLRAAAGGDAAQDRNDEVSNGHANSAERAPQWCVAPVTGPYQRRYIRA